MIGSAPVIELSLTRQVTNPTVTIFTDFLVTKDLKDSITTVKVIMTCSIQDSGHAQVLRRPTGSTPVTLTLLTLAVSSVRVTCTQLMNGVLVAEIWLI